MSYTELDQRLSIQAFKHVTFDVGSLPPTEGSNFLLDKEKDLLVLKGEDQTGQDETKYQHVGFVALKKDEVDEMPARLIIGDPTSEEQPEPESGMIVPAPLTVFNCQEAFYSLSNPKGHRFGLYAFDLQERSRLLSIGQIARMSWRIALAVTRPESSTTDTRSAGRTPKLSKQAKEELLAEERALNPVYPTLGTKRVLLQQGSLRRLGLVSDIHHNSGKRLH